MPVTQSRLIVGLFVDNHFFSPCLNSVLTRQSKQGSNLFLSGNVFCRPGSLFSLFSFIIQSIGFGLILVGVNYLIFQERILGLQAAEIENYVNQAVFETKSTDLVVLAA